VEFDFIYFLLVGLADLEQGYDIVSLLVEAEFVQNRLALGQDVVKHQLNFLFIQVWDVNATLANLFDESPV
jgi:hypothetical protein